MALMNLTKLQLADLFAGGYGFPHEIANDDRLSGAREVRARYRGVDIIRDEAQDEPRSTYWVPMGVRTGGIDDALPTVILPDDFMPITDLLSLVETIRSLDEVIDWVLREQAVAALATTMDVPRELIDMPSAEPGEQRPIATQYDVDRHAEKQLVSYADAWRNFEREGYDMSEVMGQYEGGDSA